ncbi:Tctex1 domain-containing protein [Acrasis kona]|uniref:Tctex1 domain-containing protein n=1 Tax=Acrasis kona TaxID=1008807 RepID=A0AAW2ZAF3_9EUKA
MDEGGYQQPEIKIYENSYRMDPKPGEKFLKAAVEAKANEILEKELNAEVYNANTSLQISKDIAGKLLAQIKVLIEMNYPRYKFIVQVTITSATGQGLRIASRCLWDPKKDNFATAIFKNSSLKCVAMIFGCFYE